MRPAIEIMNVRQPRNEIQCSLSTVWADKKNQIKTLFIRSTRPDRRLNRLDMFVIRLLRPDRITHDLGSLYHYIFPQALRAHADNGYCSASRDSISRSPAAAGHLLASPMQQQMTHASADERVSVCVP